MLQGFSFLHKNQVNIFIFINIYFINNIYIYILDFIKFLLLFSLGYTNFLNIHLKYNGNILND